MKRQPWVLAKDENDREKLASVMAHLAEVLRQTGIMLMPFLTVAPSKIFAQLGLLKRHINLGKVYLQLDVFQLEQKLEKGNPIFPRLEMEVEVEYIKEQMQGSAPKVEEKKAEEPKAEEITIDDFFKVELRVAEVISAEPVKKADKLLKIQLDLGTRNAKWFLGLLNSIPQKN